MTSQAKVDHLLQSASVHKLEPAPKIFIIAPQKENQPENRQTGALFTQSLPQRNQHCSNKSKILGNWSFDSKEIFLEETSPPSPTKEERLQADQGSTGVALSHSGVTLSQITALARLDQQIKLSMSNSGGSCPLIRALDHPHRNDYK